MTNCQAKHIVIGISGGIAAYKTLTLIRLFKKAGCEVKVVATRNALEFVTPLTIETLSQNKLCADLFETGFEHSVQPIAMSEWADCIVIAPATANLIGKMAHGIADDALTTMFLAFKKPIFVAPAMNHDMYRNPSVQENIEILKRRYKDLHFIETRTGALACGTEGNGRMEEPENIFNLVCSSFHQGGDLENVNVLVSAGPTYEAIDPVRFIGNHSSGQMGIAIADEMADNGANVCLVCGPTHLTCHNSNVSRINVSSAIEMRKHCVENAQNANIIIMAAAVADYRPAVVASQKIKKSDENLNIELTKNPDILLELGRNKKENQFVVGFALESENEIENAKVKLHNKNLDFIVLNSVNNPKAGFNKPTNQVTIIDKDGIVLQGKAKSKEDVAKDIVNLIIKRYNNMFK